ncbi:hypothetical protein [Caloramator australicus]|uniref:Uncharacterized protein n=1 Tax=Caloramator australicus RC3 TaxID=857293 RepID=I7J4N3_9CLOT|nr:hypothetical protein [Caloramator australicus]CCJ32771.1 hypothetical protein CAAU_0687 [Caloramator australicus RC3]
MEEKIKKTLLKSEIISLISNEEIAQKLNSAKDIKEKLDILSKYVPDNKKLSKTKALKLLNKLANNPSDKNTSFNQINKKENINQTQNNGR